MSNWTPEDLKRIERAIAKGVTSVQYEDRRIQYRTLSEMRQTRDLIRDELDSANGKKRRRRRVMRHNKGLW